MTLEAINGLSREEFVGALGAVFEDSPWVASRSFARAPFGSAGGIAGNVPKNAPASRVRAVS